MFEQNIFSPLARIFFESGSFEYLLAQYNTIKFVSQARRLGTLQTTIEPEPLSLKEKVGAAFMVFTVPLVVHFLVVIFEINIYVIVRRLN